MDAISLPRLGVQWAFDHEDWWKQLEFLEEAFPYVKKWGTAIDGGAYAGVWSARLAQKFDRVVAFEPVSENAECVRLNAPSVDLIEKALYDYEGTATYRIKGAGFAEFNEEWPLEVGCTTIDSLSYEYLGLIKLDVEGCEKKALIGATNTINEHRPVILIEMKFQPDKVALQLAKFGYRKVKESKIDQIWIYD